MHTQMSVANEQSKTPSGHFDNQIFSAIGYYKGITVAICKLGDIKRLSMTRNDQVELKSVRHMISDHDYDDDDDDANNILS